MITNTTIEFWFKKKRKKTFITDSFNKQSTPVVYNSTKFFYNNVDKDIECPIFFLAPPRKKKATRHQNLVPESPSWKIQTNLVYIVKNIEIKGIGSPLANIIILPSFPRKTVLDPCLAMDVLVLCGQLRLNVRTPRYRPCFIYCGFFCLHTHYYSICIWQTYNFGLTI